jgi:hypothetical protein
MPTLHDRSTPKGVNHLPFAAVQQIKGDRKW